MGIVEEFFGLNYCQAIATIANYCKLLQTITYAVSRS